MKGADPRRFDDPHDKEQWQKLKLLPNLVYTDGNSFSLWQDGELQSEIVRLNASDPLNLAGIITPGPRVPAVPRNALILRDGIPIAIEEGKHLTPRTEDGDTDIRETLAGLRAAAAI